VIKEKDPREALNRIAMKDKTTFEYYKDGLPQINQWIEQEMKKRQRATNDSSANRLMGH
jgi:hypothetical protein